MRRWRNRPLYESAAGEQGLPKLNVDRAPTNQASEFLGLDPISLKQGLELDTDRHVSV